MHSTPPESPQTSPLPEWRDTVPLFSMALPMMTVTRLLSAIGQPLLLFGLMTRFMKKPKLPAPLRKHRAVGCEVYIATFGKSGTNWAMQIATQIAYRGAAEFDHIHQLVPWPDGMGMGFDRAPGLTEACANPRSPTGKVVIKTHMPAHVLPYDPLSTYITVLRDPKEVVVSAYHFFLGIMGIKERVPFDLWFEKVAVCGFVASWAEHVAGFWALRDRPNVLVMNFGAMKSDLPTAVASFAEAMGVELDEDQLSEVVRRADFSYMKAHASRFAVPKMPMSRGRAAMIRKGSAGGSGELMSREQQLRIDQIAQEELRALGSDLPYAELFELTRER